MQEVLTPVIGKQPFNTSFGTDYCASGQYNDEYTEDAHQKMIKPSKIMCRKMEFHSRY